MNKQLIINDIIKQLEQELSDCLVAADNAHLAATDDQSVAETQYDTLAIEAGYLAEGQAKRAAEIKQAILAYQQLILRKFSEQQPIALGALVLLEKVLQEKAQLNNAQQEQQWLFIGPAAGGYKSTVQLAGNKQIVTIVTPSSPMAQALMGKCLDDEIMLNASSEQWLSIVAIS